MSAWGKRGKGDTITTFAEHFDTLLLHSISPSAPISRLRSAILKQHSPSRSSTNKSRYFRHGTADSRTHTPTYLLAGRFELLLSSVLVLLSSLGVDASSSALEAAAKKVGVGSADMKSNWGKSTGSSISSTMIPSLS